MNRFTGHWPKPLQFLVSVALSLAVPYAALVLCVNSMQFLIIWSGINQVVPALFLVLCLVFNALNIWGPASARYPRAALRTGIVFVLLLIPCILGVQVLQLLSYVIGLGGLIVGFSLIYQSWVMTWFRKKESL